MADKYPDFYTLSQNETSGIDYIISLRQANNRFAIVAPHGGGIEPGTTELADAIASESLSFYAFDGIKPRGNVDLHITSTNFDEPICVILLSRTETVVTMHGEGDAAGEGVFLGGLDKELGESVEVALTAAGFTVRRHPNRKLQGLEPENVCNRGTSGKGVQLELSNSVRRQMFRSLSREGRKCTTEKFDAFVEAVRSSVAVRSSI
jgi:phage replication-related protein YjqB (UPF0714/DUF867 family)